MFAEISQRQGERRVTLSASCVCVGGASALPALPVPHRRAPGPPELTVTRRGFRAGNTAGRAYRPGEDLPPSSDDESAGWADSDGEGGRAAGDAAAAASAGPGGAGAGSGGAAAGLRSGAGDVNWDAVVERALERSGAECPICLQALQLPGREGPLAWLSCSHVFHAECLGTFELYAEARAGGRGGGGGARACPMCREGYVKKCL